MSVPEVHFFYPTYRQYLAPSHEQPRKWRHPNHTPVNVNVLQYKLCAYPSNVTRGRQAQSANQAGTHVRKDIPVQVGHYHNTITVRPWILRYLSSGRCQT